MERETEFQKFYNHKCLWCGSPISKWWVKYCQRPKLCRNYAYRERKRKLGKKLMRERLGTNDLKELEEVRRIIKLLRKLGKFFPLSLVEQKQKILLDK